MKLFSKYFEVGGHALHVLHAGPSTLPGMPPDLSRGRAILFLHPAGLDGGVWHRQLRHLENRGAAIAFDLPAHGRSAGTEAPASIAESAAVVVGLLDRLGIDRAVLVGSSLGATIALETALREPARVCGLVLAPGAARVDVPAEAIETWRRVTMGRASQPFDPYGHADGTSMEILREHWTHQVMTDPRVRHGDLVAANGVDFAVRLGDVPCPVLVVNGSADPIVPPAMGAALAASLPHARHVVIEGAGHFLYAEKPAELCAAIDSFLEELR